MSTTVLSALGPTFGYADEVSAVRQALTDPDRCGCLIIGPAGSGRTTVMNRALEHMEREAPVFRLRGSEMLRDRELGVLEFLLNQAGVNRDIGLGAALSVIARVFSSSDSAALPIVQIDNSNLVDGESLSVLCQLADARRIRLVVGAESIRPPVDFVANLWLGGSMTRVDLGGLDEAVIAALTGVSVTTTRSAPELLRDTGGNPRLLNQVVFGVDHSLAHERILWNIPAGLRPILEIIAMVTTAPYECLARLRSVEEIDELADKGLVTMDRGRGSGVRLSEPVIAETLKAQVMPAQSLRLFKVYENVVDVDALSGGALFGYLRWGLSLGFEQPEDKVFAASVAANAEGRQSDVADFLRASGWETDRVLLELARAEKGRGGIAEANRLFDLLLSRTAGNGVAEAAEGTESTAADTSEPDSQRAEEDCHLSRLACMDIRLTDPATPECLRTQWVRDRLTTADNIGRVDVTRAQFELRGGRIDEGLSLAEAVYHDHGCMTRHRLRACAILGVGRVARGQVDLGIHYINQAELMFELPGLTTYEREDAAPHIFVARYLAGDWSGARRSVRRAGAGDRMAGFVGALVDVRTGHPARAQSALHELIAHAQDTDLIDIAWVCRAAKRYVDALLGQLPDPEQLLDFPRAEFRPDRYSWWVEFEARYFDLQALALARPGAAAAQLHALGLGAVERGAATVAANALMEAARLGHVDAAQTLAEVGGDLDGKVGRLARATATGLLGDDPQALLDAARAALEFGAVVTCSDLAKLAQKRAVEANDRAAAKEARILIGNSTHAVRFSSVGSRLHAVLTEFERKLVDGVMAGSGSQELGAQHHLSTRTIEWHLTRIYRRLEVANRRELRDLVSSWGAHR